MDDNGKQSKSRFLVWSIKHYHQDLSSCV
uniref:Uncharacterized protein n=1 Tax=Arundo donax TaxID=35708 RepID=A0A0A9EMC8_ARUDO